MPGRTDIEARAVRALAVAGDLPLAEGRDAVIAGQLSDWLAAANELSTKMSAPQYAEIQPVTTFRHPGQEDSGNG